MYNWKVCPVQGRQLLDVDPKDIHGDFRICNTYKSGGGYDQFPVIANHRGIESDGDLSTQFVVQLEGCHLRCPYCYVTRDGIYGKTRSYTSRELMLEMDVAFDLYDAGVFHLMGGAPALYMKHWPELITLLDDYAFHSDLLLTEFEYDPVILEQINYNYTLYAVNVKGVTSEDHLKNTGKEIDWKMFWSNLNKLVEANLNFYLTFTNPDLSYFEEFKSKLINGFGEWILDDHFVIDLKEYDALKEGPAW